MSNLNLNGYQITWVAFIPVKGFATAADAKIAAAAGSNKLGGKTAILNHFANLTAANAHIANMQGKLCKEYTAYCFSDKQYGKAILGKINGNGILIGGRFTVSLTEKQAQAAILVRP